ncbi:MAG: T9SS type A sorting domain-containing protein [Saprospiraceae bacterium]|nr:T9SS type A sorting domain-containing protein [Saprospiraceae bacterium]
MKKQSQILILLLLTLNALYSQKENNNWLFGQNCGLSFSPFNTSLPSSLSTYEGSASISDQEGNLLFYTDGVKVYNRNGGVMNPVTNLWGDPSSTSSAIIVPRPCSTTEYFIFTVDFILGNNGINYSLVDMDDNGDCFVSPTDLGQIVQSNVNLPGPNGEKICVVKHANELDYWIITNKANSNNFFVYELTQGGVNHTPVTSNSGPIIGSYGYLKGSSSGSQLAIASSSISQNGKVEMYFFDPSTGVITHNQTISPNREFVYGVEFSDNEDYVYFSCDDLSTVTPNAKEIYSVDLTLATPTHTLVHTSPDILPANTYSNLGALQITPDRKKILIAKGRTNFLDAIDNPNFGGTYLVDDVPLANMSYVGLPHFVTGDLRKCKPLDMVAYRPTAPDLFPPAIKTEIISAGIHGIDKEYGDIDADGDIDILFTKSITPQSKSLHVFKNSAGYCTGNAPSFPNPAIPLGLDNCNSFRLFDWNGDGYNDLIIHGSPDGIEGIFLYIADGTGGYLPSDILLDGSNFDYEPFQFIEVGDLNHDGLPDLLISGNDSYFIEGTDYYENNGLGGVTFIAKLIPGNGGSLPIPEMYDADCQNGLDILMSDPLFGPPPLGGGRMYFHENSGVASSGTLPNINIAGVTNQFGFNDIPQSVSLDLACDWVVTRIVDFFNDGCPIAISYSECTDKLVYYPKQNCLCSTQPVPSSTNEVEKEKISMQIFPNPTTSVVQVELTLMESTEANITLFDLQGRRLRTLANTFMSTEHVYNESFDVSDLSSGVYLIHAITEKGFSGVERLVIVR